MIQTTQIASTHVAEGTRRVATEGMVYGISLGGTIAAFLAF
jgi:hypothetical protein